MTEIILGEMLATMPFRVFAYIPFRNHLRVRNEFLPLYLMAVEIVNLLCFGLMLYNGASVEAAKLIQVPLSFVAFMAMVRQDFGKIMFIFVFAADYIIAVRGAAMFAEYYIAPDGLPPLTHGFLVLGIFVLSVPAVLYFINRTAEMVFETNAPEVWRTIWILPTLTSIIVVMYTIDSDKMGVTFLLTRIILLVTIFLMYYWIIEVVRNFQKKIEAEEHIRSLRQLSAIQESQYETLSVHVEEWRHFRHDLRQHLRVISGCIESNDIQYLSRYIAEYSDSLPPEKTRRFCKNIAVDAVLRFYSDRAFMRNVDFEADVRMEESPVPEHELCVLLGNLLENAIDAAEQGEGVHYVKAHVRRSGSMLTVTVDNTSPHKPNIENGRLVSTKHEGMGVGTASVAVIAERYNGDARFEWRDGVFYASVMLNP